MTPAVLYNDAGEAGKSTSLAIPTKIVDYTLHHFGDNALYDIALGGGYLDGPRRRRPPRPGLRQAGPRGLRAGEHARDASRSPSRCTVVGEAPGVDEGGVLQQVAYEIQVESLPGDIPQEITIDVSEPRYEREPNPRRPCAPRGR